MTNVTKHVETMVKRSSEIAAAFNDMHQSLFALGQTESESISFGFSQLATSLDQLYGLTEKHADSETINFAEPLQEYSRMLGSIKAAVHQRQEKKNMYLQAMGDVDAKQAAHRKVMGVPGKESQAKAKEQAVINSQEACEQARKEFERVTERLLTEFEVFKTQKGIDLKDTLLSYVNTQVRL